MWLEDPVPPYNAEAMAYVRKSVNVPICFRRKSLRPARLPQTDSTASVRRGAHRHPEERRLAGIESAISDLAEMYYIWTACHNPASPVGTIASAHAASAMRNFRIHELAKWIDWLARPCHPEGPFWENGYFTIQDKPGYGIELIPTLPRRILLRASRGGADCEFDLSTFLYSG